MQKRLTVDPRYTKTYGTPERAIKAADAIQKRLGLDIANAIVVCGDERDRYSPVFLPSQDEVSDALALAHNGFKIVRT